MRGPCRATESTWPKGGTIEVVIESRQTLVVGKLWHVPHYNLNTPKKTAEIKTTTRIPSINRMFQHHQKCSVKVLLRVQKIPVRNAETMTDLTH